MVGGGERNPASPSVVDVGVGRDIGGSHRGDQPRGHGGVNEEGRRAIATGMPGPEGARRKRERSCMGDDDAISVEIQWRDDGARCKVLTASLVDAHFQALVLGRVIPGSGRLLPGDRLQLEIWADRIREEADSEE